MNEKESKLFNYISLFNLAIFFSCKCVCTRGDIESIISIIHFQQSFENIKQICSLIKKMYNHPLVLKIITTTGCLWKSGHDCFCGNIRTEPLFTMSSLFRYAIPIKRNFTKRGFSRQNMFVKIALVALKKSRPSFHS